MRKISKNIKSTRREDLNNVELTAKKLNTILIIMTIGAFITSLSQSLLTSALPAIMKEFVISATVGQWLTTVYVMVLGIVTSTTAYLINRFNTKHLFLTAMGLFLTGCFFSIKAPIFLILLFSRILQACGAGILMPLIQVIALRNFPVEQHGKAMGIVGLVVAFGPAIGPTLSGILVDAFGWRSIFYLLGVISLTVIVLAMRNFIDLGEKKNGRMDFVSAISYGIGFTGLMLGVTNRERFGFISSETLLPLLAGLFFLLFFIYRQLNSREPLLKIRIFGNWLFAITSVLNIITYLAMISGTIMVPIYIQSVRGLPALTSGLVLLPGSMLLAVLSPITGYLLDKYKARLVSISGMILLTIGTGSFMFFGDSTSLILVTFFYSLRMTGVAFLLMPLTAYGIGALDKEDISHGTALVISIRQMLGALGTSIMVAIMVVASKAQPAIDVHGVNLSFGVQAVIFFLGLICTWKYIKK